MVIFVTCLSESAFGTGRTATQECVVISGDLKDLRDDGIIKPSSIHAPSVNIGAANVYIVCLTNVSLLTVDSAIINC